MASVCSGAGAFALVFSLGTLAAQNPPASWLDRPLTGWNKVGAAVPAAPSLAEAKDTLISRCRLTPPRSTRAEQAVDAAGWIPFWNVDQQLVREEVEIVGGMRGANAACQPAAYNLFVFVGGEFAGTLSPTEMTTASDSSSGVVRMPRPSANTEFSITAEFARYQNADALCCPSARIAVRYRIERTAAGPLVVPVEIRTTRTH